MRFNAEESTVSFNKISIVFILGEQFGTMLAIFR